MYAQKNYIYSYISAFPKRNKKNGTLIRKKGTKTEDKTNENCNFVDILFCILFLMNFNYLSWIA